MVSFTLPLCAWEVPNGRNGGTKANGKSEPHYRGFLDHGKAAQSFTVLFRVLGFLLALGFRVKTGV